ncbi:MAG: hypothetical protein U5L45_18510 [Saprospiraceae bacterium]|nr:hypothetical protein [Saprospiraceae bacterium]
MYLAPLNFDRFFHRIFSDSTIAKSFFEDFLSVEITHLEPLPRKNKLTDDAAFVEYDYRCRIDDQYFILDMQQWYKQDVVKRFYLYFCNNTSLQLELLKSVNIPIPNGRSYKTKNYDQVEPSITLVWMADDVLEFKEDIIAYSFFPEMMNEFMQNDELWSTSDKETLLGIRQKILNIVNNKHKNLDFLPKNRLIFMFQSNIVRNHKLSTYFDWFDFAEKTKNKKNTINDFKPFLKNPIFAKMTEKLKTSVLEHDDFQYIDDYDAYVIGVKNYDEKVRNEALKEAKESLKETLKQHAEAVRKVEARVARAKAEAAAAKTEAKAAKTEAAKTEAAKILQEKKKAVKNMYQKGFALELIADILEIPVSQVNVLLAD